MRVWHPEAGGRLGFDLGRRTDAAPQGEYAPTVCPGYSCNLPEVIETARGRLHWSKGQLAVFAGGQPSERLIEQIEILEGQVNAVELWRMTPASKGGGMDG